MMSEQGYWSSLTQLMDYTEAAASQQLSNVMQPLQASGSPASGNNVYGC